MNIENVITGVKTYIMVYPNIKLEIEYSYLLTHTYMSLMGCSCESILRCFRQWNWRRLFVWK